MVKKVFCGITLTWKKIVAVIAGFLGIGTLTSCYGMPITDPYHTPDGSTNVIFEGVVTDKKGNGIPGIKVTSNYATTKSKENGYFEVLAYYPIEDPVSTLTFIDIDGEENGSFESKSVNKKKPDDYNPEINITGEGVQDELLIDIGKIVLTNKE